MTDKTDKPDHTTVHVRVEKDTDGMMVATIVPLPEVTVWLETQTLPTTALSTAKGPLGTVISDLLIQYLPTIQVVGDLKLFIFSTQPGIFDIHA